jgi:hypothetical protein
MRFAISGFLRAVAHVLAPPGWRIALKEQNKTKNTAMASERRKTSGKARKTYSSI